jgi:DNA-binding transcriptional LysR family regulator
VAEVGNFTRAAERHYVAQSALSQQIARLEGELGTVLFHRDSRSVRLTEAAEVLLPLARRIIADAENARMEMDAFAGLHRGTLRLGLIQAPATSVDILGVMGDFHERHPGIRFEITDGTSAEMVAAVTAAGLDVALVGLEPSEIAPPVTGLLLAFEPLVAVVSSGGPLAGLTRIGLAELAAAGQFIHFRWGSGLRNRVEAAFHRAGRSPAAAFEMGQVSDMVELAARGVGVTIVPRTRLVEAGTLNGVPFTCVPLDDDARHPVSVIHHPKRLSSAGAAFIEELTRHTGTSSERPAFR